MLINCFFPKTTDVIDDSKVLTECDATADMDASENDVENDITDDDDVAQDYRDDLSLRDAAEKGLQSTSGNNIIGDFSVFRDFFLAAFSDGYYKVNCCGSEGLFPGSSDCIPQKRAKDISQTDSFGSGNHRGEIITVHQNNDLSMSRTGSQEGMVIGVQRKRPLAVAVGFKYAEDLHGRPIVITPGCRRMPVINRSGSRQSQPSSPASQPINTKTIELAPNSKLSFPIDYDPNN